MASKLVIGSIVLIAVGLVLVVVGDPSIRFLAASPTPTGTTRTFTFNGGFNVTGSNFTGTFPGNFTRTGSGASFVAGRVTTATLESLGGIALVGAGLLLEVFSVFIRPWPAIAAPKA